MQAEITREIDAVRKNYKKTKNAAPKLKSALQIERTDRSSLKSKY